jgi:sugar/nucleoside kinase (ribokinase family)
MSELVIIGSVALDNIEGPGGKRDNVLGGSATYASYSASFFTKPRLVACIGKDFPADARATLAARPIDLAGLETIDGPTFRWTGKYAPAFRTRDTLALDLGVFMQFNPKLAKPLPKDSILLLGNIDPDLQLKVLDQAGSECFVAADTIDHWIKNKRDVLLKGLKRTHLMFLNNEEAELLTGESNIFLAGEAIKAMGPKMVVIKKGEHGAVLFSEEGLFLLSALPLTKIVDPTGAGDVFAGAMLGVMASTGARDAATLRLAMAKATVMSSFAVEDFGVTRMSKLQDGEIDTRLNRLRELVRF